jgi:hypothetical protein
MKIVSIALSKKKGTRKIQVEKALVVEGHGIRGDAIEFLPEGHEAC